MPAAEKVVSTSPLHTWEYDEIPWMKVRKLLFAAVNLSQDQQFSRCCFKGVGLGSGGGDGVLHNVRGEDSIPDYASKYINIFDHRESGPAEPLNDAYCFYTCARGTHSLFSFTSGTDVGNA